MGTANQPAAIRLFYATAGVTRQGLMGDYRGTFGRNTSTSAAFDGLGPAPSGTGVLNPIFANDEMDSS